MFQCGQRCKGEVAYAKQGVIWHLEGVRVLQVSVNEQPQNVDHFEPLLHHRSNINLLSGCTHFSYTNGLHLVITFDWGSPNNF